MIDIRLSRRAFGLLVAGGITATACGARGGTSASNSLRIGQFWPPASLDPARAGGESQLYFAPAYEPLIYRAPDGSHQPRLATSWGYLGSGNTAFELTLRSGVTFSDGSELTATAVKASIEHFRGAAGQAAAFLAAISAIETTGALTLRISLSAPHPHLPELFTQDYFAGNVISPAATAAPGQLATRTFGTGPYVLSAEATVASDHYTYTPNPSYWDRQAFRYDKLTIKVLPNENTALDALRTGQVDVISGSYAIAGGAKAAGLRVAASPNLIMGIQLNDRSGTLCPPLADTRVRQALNFAVNREKITKALLGEYGVPTEQPSVPGMSGHQETNFYRYDQDRARELLATAGYGSGFRLPVLIPSTPAYHADLVQAMAGDLERVGVRLEISAKDPTAGSAEAGKYPASIMGWGVLPVYFMGRGLWLRDAVGMNPFHSTDPALEELDRRAAAADDAARPALDRQIVRRVVELGWFLPVCLSPVFLFHRDTVAIDAVPGKALPSVVAWHRAS